MTFAHLHIHFGALRAIWRHIETNSYCSKANFQIFPFFYHFPPGLQGRVWVQIFPRQRHTDTLGNALGSPTRRSALVTSFAILAHLRSVATAQKFLPVFFQNLKTIKNGEEFSIKSFARWIRLVKADIILKDKPIWRPP